MVISPAQGWTAAAVAAGVGLLAGILGSLWWARRRARERRRIPTHWPLVPRRMASSAESIVWRWLDRAFLDHHVMIKVPVTRFTLPRGGQNSAHWHQLLSGVYCTFTICAHDGHVVGCVDVLGPSGITRGNRQLKVTLLSQCGIGYWIIKPDNLPNVAEIRTDFLGDSAQPRATGLDEAQLNQARQKLQAAVDRQRHQRHSLDEFGLGDRRGSAGNKEILDKLLSDSEFSSGHWQQPNSFIAPLDSRPAKLR